MIALYVDGACSGNPGPGGFGAVVVEYEDSPENGSVIRTYSEKSDSTTNNRMEMSAIIWALENYGNWHNKGNKYLLPPIVYSDSAYCVNSFTNWIHGWKANGWTRAKGKKLENLDLIKRYDELTTQGYTIDLRKIAGHAGHKWNEMADDLAVGRITSEEMLRK